MENSKVKTGFWIDKNLMEEIDASLEKAHAHSRGEFVKKAVLFYTSYLNAVKTEEYLLPTISAYLKGYIGGTEDRISKLLYKLTVEISMMNRILAYDKELDEVWIDYVRELSEKEVQEIVGYWEKNS